MARSSIVKLGYRWVETFSGKDPCLLRRISFRTGHFVWVKIKNSLFSRPSTFSWYQLDSIACASSTLRAVSQVKMTIHWMLCPQLGLPQIRRWRNIHFARRLFSVRRNYNDSNEKHQGRRRNVYKLWCRLQIWTNMRWVQFFVTLDVKQIYWSLHRFPVAFNLVLFSCSTTLSSNSLAQKQLWVILEPGLHTFDTDIEAANQQKERFRKKLYWRNKFYDCSKGRSTERGRRYQSATYVEFRCLLWNQKH